MNHIRNMSNEDLFFVDKEPMTECTICMEMINDTDKTVLKCGHKFHASCMFSSVIANNNNCPLCRTNICEKTNIAPQMTGSLMRLFIQDEFNHINVSNCLQEVFESTKKMCNHKNWDDVDFEQRSMMSAQLMKLLVSFGMNLGTKVDAWIQQGNERMSIPEDYNMEPLQVPQHAYMNQYDDDISIVPINNDENDELSILPEENHIINIISHDIEPDYRQLNDFLVSIGLLLRESEQDEIFSTSLFEDKIRSHEWVFTNLRNISIDELMYPPGVIETRDLPFFTRNQAESIISKIIIYNTSL